jgi:hypothetical protein
MAKKKVVKKIDKSGEPSVQDILELKRKKLKEKQKAILLREETKKEVEARPASTVIDTSKKYPEYMCWRCKGFTPYKFTCKHCKEKNPHRDIKKDAK